VDLPPAKGDSDTGGLTPDDVQVPEGTLLEVRGLKKYFPVKGGFFGRESARSGRWTASASGSAAPRRWAWWASRAPARPPPAARCSG
jgi:hypothetical protein